MSTTTLITAEEFAEMSFDVPVELIKGEIVEMTLPGGWHGAICFNTAGLLRDWIRGGADFRAMTNDSGVILERDPDTVRGPDLLVIRRDRLPGGEIPRKLFEVPPDVAIEVKSPTDRWSEIHVKVGMFFAAGTGEVWVIDPDHRRVHIFHAEDEPTILNEGETVSSALLPGFSVPVSDFFEGIGTSQ
jgi:Uma2 family endonuclease